MPDRGKAAAARPEPDAARSRTTAGPPGSEVETALVDTAGVIVAVDAAWQRFCLDNGGDPAGTGVGVSYLAICDSVPGDPPTQEVAAAIRAAATGDLPAPVRIRIDCPAPGIPREFDVLVGPRRATTGEPLGASVTISPVAVPPAGDDDRLTAALDAATRVTGRLEPAAVLQNLLAAAQDLVGARTAVLALLGPDGTVAEVLSAAGAADEAAAGQPALPAVLADIAAGSRAVLREGRGRLGVRVPTRSGAIGALYLTAAAPTGFTGEDERSLVALAALAGMTIDAARLAEESERQRRWLEATARVTQTLFAGGGHTPMTGVLQSAAEAADGDFAYFALLDPGGALHVEAAHGSMAEELRHTDQRPRVPQLRSVLTDGRPALVTDHPVAGGTGSTRNGRRTGTAVIAPLLGDSRVLGALCVGRAPGRVPFTAADLDRLAGFAAQAGVALRLDRARTDRERLLVAEEQARIAAELHEHVVARLFSVGIGMQALVRLLERPEDQQRLLALVDALDETISDVRTTVFGAHGRTSPAGALRRRLTRLLDRSRGGPVAAASLEFSGAMDQLGEVWHDELVAVVRDALVVVGRHSGAGRVDVRLTVADGIVRVDVLDDAVRSSGAAASPMLAALRRRAEDRGGSLELATTANGGSHLRWSAPLSLGDRVLRRLPDG